VTRDAVRLTDFQVLSFDCYGTLIDWERGILRALEPLRGQLCNVTDDMLLSAFATFEAAQELETPARGYRDVLTDVHAALARRLSLRVPEAWHARFGRSVPEWPAFPDSRPALAELKQRYRLVVLSNVDHESFHGSQAQLGVEFDAVYTAEDIGSYKPSPANFEYLVAHVRADFGIERAGILHVAQSLFHDHVPAKAAGLATAWIDQRAGAGGWGATKPPAEIPAVDFRFRSLAELAAAVRQDVDAGRT
jgi:2-haloacid dehalogenase